MKHSFYSLVLALIALPLAGCGGNDDGVMQGSVTEKQVTVDELAAGVYTVSTGNADAPTVGSYHAGTDGSRLLVLSNTNGQTEALYRREASGAWVAVPAATQNVTVKLLRSDTVPVVALTASALAGSYVTQIAPGNAAQFTVNADGAIVAGATTCKLSGRMATGTLPNTLKLNLTATGCGSLPATSTGAVVVSSDEVPARFKLIADNGAHLLDLWAFVE